jgi:hypothetical protein
MIIKQKLDKSAFTISGCGSRGIVYRLTGVPAWLKEVRAIFKTVPRNWYYNVDQTRRWQDD